MKQHLNFSWRFVKGFDLPYLEKMPREAETIDLPHCPKQVPLSHFDEKSYQTVYTYEKYFDDDAPLLEKKILRFEGAMLKMRVILNDRDYGDFISGYLPVEIDVSDSLKPTENRLLVIVDSREDPNIPPFGNIVDYLSFAGLYREVSLLSYPKSHIKDVFIKADMHGTLEVKTEIENPDPNLKISHFLYRDGKEIARFLGEVVTIPSPRLWSIEDPYLYLLKTVYGEDERVDEVGFRSISFTPKGFFLNGKKVKLVGTNRHQTYPYIGGSAPKAMQEDDADIIKKTLGFNVVRTSHYPQSEHFLSRCDHIGLLVLTEIPGWQHIGDQDWKQVEEDFCRRMILKERNHPSLIAYGLRVDESQDDHYFYAKIQAIKAELDPTRPSLGVRNFKNSELLEDIYAYNDFSTFGLDHGLDESKTYTKKKAPVLVTECMGHVFPTKTYDTAARRLEHALKHARILDDAYKDENLSGMLCWCAFDYNTHKDFGSFDHICHHGLMDINRLPKEAAYFYASQFVPNTFHVASSMNPGDEDVSLMPVAYVFSDAEYVELYRDGELIKGFFPDSKDYPHLPHPPFKIDDFFGEALVNEGFKKKDAEKMAPALNKVAVKGFDSLDKGDYLLLARMSKKYKLRLSYITDMFSRFVYPRGEGKGTWEFVGYKEGKVFARQKVGAPTSFHYEVIQSKSKLHNDETYDASKITIRKLDEFGNIAPYSFDPILLEARGPVKLLSPALISLRGGMATVYVASKKSKAETKAEVSLFVEGEQYLIDFDVD